MQPPPQGPRPAFVHPIRQPSVTLSRVNAVITILLDWLSKAEGLYGLAGPIFEKELRVSGRLKRSYILRFGYIAVLGMFVGMVWLTTVTIPGLYGVRGLQSLSMAYAGLMLTTTIIWFQFIVLQPVAVVMLSTSISDEVYHRTLGVLMTTPINNTQVVLGKFLGRLYQMVLLMALSVPILVVIRVMGGVTAEFVLAGTCITVVTIAFISAVTMFFSVSSRNAPLVIAKTVTAVLIMYLVLPLIWMYGTYQAGVRPLGEAVIPFVNPYVSLSIVSSDLYSPAGVSGYQWWIHCVIGLGATILVLLATMIRVRRAALRQIIGSEGGRSRSGGAVARIRRVTGSPVIWKEARGRIFKNRLRGMIGTGALLAVLCFTYWASWTDLSFSSAQIVYAEVLIIFGTLATAVVTAGTITGEKETGVWSILLTTPLDSRDIVLGKIVGVLRRSLPAWVPLGFHLVIFTLLGQIHFITIPLVALLVLGICVLMASSGVLFGTLMKRTMMVTVANLLVCVVLWMAIPVVLGIGLAMIAGVLRDNAAAVEPLLSIYTLHPGVQVWLIFDGGAGTENVRAGLVALKFRTLLPHEWHSETDAIGMLGIILMSLVFHAGLAALFIRSAIGLLRRNII
jgi:ABC-type transport system involved in multi-copper enzyme maturation permease subunit